MIDMELNLFSTGIAADGRKRWQETDAYQQKISEIKNVARAKYNDQLKQERNWLCRLSLIIKRKLEISEQIAKLDSERNLHLIRN